MLEGEGFGERLRAAQRHVDEIWATPALSWFTDHGPSHSLAVEEFACQLIPDTEFLTAEEWFVLIVAARLHDIGMQSTGGVGKPLEDFVSADYENVRRSHPTQSRSLIHAASEQLLLDPELANAVGLVAQAHGTEWFLESAAALTELTPPANAHTFRGELLAGVLLIADELDLHNRRCIWPKAHEPQHSATSLAHHLKHYFVSWVRVSESRGRVSLKIRLEFPDSVNRSDRLLIERWIVMKLRRQLALVSPTLEERTDDAIRFSRAIAVESRDEVGGARADTEVPAAVRHYIDEEVSRWDLVDLDRHVNSLVGAVSNRVQLYGIGGRDGPDDPDGREEIRVWLEKRIHETAFQSSDDRRGSAVDALTALCEDMGLTVEPGDSLEGFADHIARFCTSEPPPAVLVLPGVDRLPRGEREKLQSVLVDICKRTAVSIVVTAETDILNGLGHFELLGAPDPAELVQRYLAVTNDEATMAMPTSGDTYAEHRAMLDRFEIGLARG